MQNYLLYNNYDTTQYSDVSSLFFSELRTSMQQQRVFEMTEDHWVLLFTALLEKVYRGAIHRFEAREFAQDTFHLLVQRKAFIKK